MESTSRRFDTLSRLKAVASATAAPHDQPLVRFEHIDAQGYQLPVYVPADDSVDAAAWARQNRSLLSENLLKYGALLFRGFDIHEPSTFERYCLAFCDELFADNGEHPRGSVSKNVYTPVFYPPEKRLLWHNENSF